MIALFPAAGIVRDQNLDWEGHLSADLFSPVGQRCLHCFGLSRLALRNVHTFTSVFCQIVELKGPVS